MFVVFDVSPVGSKHSPGINWSTFYWRVADGNEDEIRGRLVMRDPILEALIIEDCDTLLCAYPAGSC